MSPTQDRGRFYVLRIFCTRFKVIYAFLLRNYNFSHQDREHPCREQHTRSMNPEFMVYCKCGVRPRDGLLQQARLLEHGLASFENTSLTVKVVRKTFYLREASPASYSIGGTLWMF